MLSLKKRPAIGTRLGSGWDNASVIPAYISSACTSSEVGLPALCTKVTGTVLCRTCACILQCRLCFSCIGLNPLIKTYLCNACSVIRFVCLFQWFNDVVECAAGSSTIYHISSHFAVPMESHKPTPNGVPCYQWHRALISVQYAISEPNSSPTVPHRFPIHLYHCEILKET